MNSQKLIGTLGTRWGQNVHATFAFVPRKSESLLKNDLLEKNDLLDEIIEKSKINRWYYMKFKA